MTPFRGWLIALFASASCATPRQLPPATTSASPARAPCGPYGLEAPTQRSAFEERVWAELLRAARRPRPLRPSAALDRAARAIAEDSARGEPRPLARRRVQGALRAAGAWDPAPVAHLASGPADEALAALLARIGTPEATHAGIGVQEAGGVHHVAILLSPRRATVERFPGAVAPGSEATLAGGLVGLLHPRAWVTRPDGSNEELALRGGRTFSAPVRFAEPGRHQVEVTGTGGSGPEVAALLVVSVGGGPCDAEPLLPAAGPEDAGRPAAGIVGAVNALRRARGLEPLSSSDPLSAVATRHSQRMLASREVAHVLPGGGELGARLTAAGIPFQRAFENVASGETAGEAHAAIEASPAHLANLLAPSASRIGVGLARGALPTGEHIVYLTEILVEPPEPPSLGGLTLDARIREALWRERARRGLPPLTQDPILESLAQDAARAMRAEDSGEVEGLTAGALKLGRRLAAADSFIARAPDEAIRSRNLGDARFRRVGVGVVTGDSRRFGPARLFIAVVYSD